MNDNRTTVDAEHDLVLDISVVTLQDVAPEELPAFHAHQEDYLQGKVSADGTTDTQLGFGLELVPALAPFVVEAARIAVNLIVTAVESAVSDETKSLVTAWLDRKLHRATASSPPTGDRANASGTQLPPDLLRQIGTATYEVCIQMGAQPVDATLVSSAVVGRVAVT